MPDWKRALGALCIAVVAALGVLPGGGATPTSARAATTAPPPGLLVLEQRMSELKISSVRFSLQTSVSAPSGEREVLSLLKLFGLNSRTSGEATTAPASANVSLDFFGQKLTLRSVGNTVYAYFGKLARYDHGRPWIRLGRAGLVELFTVNGHPVHPSAKMPEPRSGEPKLAEPPFTTLANLLAGAHEVHELGPGVVDGQPVTRFMAVLEPAQLKSKPFASASRLLATPPPPTATLEVSLAANGLPLRTVLTVQDSSVTTSGILEIPAVNFPLVIEAPPAAQTIGLKQLRELEKRQHKRARKK